MQNHLTAPPGPLTLRSLTLDPPLINASGAFDVAAADPDWSASYESAAVLGAYVTKTITWQARAGNPEPWVEQLAEGTLVNSVGLANPGIVAVLREWDKVADQLACPTILSLGGTADELREMAAMADAQAAWVRGFELNLSCPNIHHSGSLAAGDARQVSELAGAVRAATDLPIIAKLSAAASDVSEVARAAEAAGVDAVCAINTMPIVALDDECEPLLGSATGGMSGAMLHPIALSVVRRASAAVSVPVIGVGGVSSRASARRMFACGASAVGVGTAAALAPSVLADIAQLWRPAARS